MLLARNAMATRFEMVLHGDDPAALRAAGEEALDEIDRLESQLSLYRPGSELARLNERAQAGPVRVTPALFHLLRCARDFSRESGGAFDITIAPLVRCWGFMGGTGSMPDPTAVAAAREAVGMQWVELEEKDLTVRFTRPGVMLDLGAIGKGFAVDRAAEILRETGVKSALLHGGTSTAYAIGRPPGGLRWKITIPSADNIPDAPPLATVEIEDESLSVSAVWGRSFHSGGRSYGHVIDPRTGQPAAHARLSAVILPCATDTDALSTALLTAPELLDSLVKARPQIRCLVVRGTEAASSVLAHGLSLDETF